MHATRTLLLCSLSLTLGALASRLLILKSSLSDLVEKTRGQEPADN